MKKTLIILVAISMLLAACASQATPNPTPTTAPPTPTQPEPTATTPPTATSEPTAEAEPEAAATATEAPTPTAEVAANVITFNIIPAESQASYEVGETFLENNQFAVAVGVTTEMAGSINVDYDNPQNITISTITVDLSTLTSDQGRRDRYIRENGLESSKFPMATFVPTQIEGLPATGEEGSEYNLKVTGDLTVKETTNPVTFDVTVKLDGNTLSGEATTTVLLSDFGVGPISLLGILNT